MNLLERLGRLVSDIVDGARLTEAENRLLERASADLAQGRFDAALQGADRLLQVRPGLWRALVVRGFALRALGRYAEAQEVLERARQERDLPLVRIELARVAAQVGDPVLARSHLQAVEELPARGDELLEARLQRAQICKDLDDPRGEIDALLALQKDPPEATHEVVRIASRLGELGRERDAVTLLQPFRGRDGRPTQIEVIGPLYELALSLDDAELHRELEQELLRIPEQDAPYTTLAALGRAHERAHAYASAVATYRALLQRAPAARIPEYLLRYADVLLRLRAYGDAADVARAAYLLGAGSDSVRIAVEGLFAAEDYSGLQAFAQDGAAAVIGTDSGLRALHGRALVRLGYLDDARAVLNPLRSAGATAASLLALGELALESGDATEAAAMLRDARAAGAAGREVDALYERALSTLRPALPIPEDIAELDALAMSRLLDALEDDFVSHPLSHDVPLRAARLREALDAPLSVAVVGEFNAGKSTLINAFVGETMLATGVLPTTSHANVIRYGPRPVARWTDEQGEVSELPFSEAATLVKERPEDIAELEFRYPHPDLRSIHFWDTPGFNAPDEDHELRAESALERADAIVWVMDANQALSSTQFDRVSTVSRPEERLLVVLNKVERLAGDDDAVAALKEHVHRGLQGRYAGFFPVSALLALRARTNPDGDASEDRDAPSATQAFDPLQAWSELDQALRTTFFERAGRLKSLESLKGLERLVKDVSTRAERKAAELERVASALRELRLELQYEEHRLRDQRLTQIARELEQSVGDERSRFVARAATLRGTVGGLFLAPRRREENRAQLAESLHRQLDAIWADCADTVVEAQEGLALSWVHRVEEASRALHVDELRALRRRIEHWFAIRDELTAQLRQRIEDYVEGELRSRIELVLPELTGASSVILATEVDVARLGYQLVPSPRQPFEHIALDWLRRYFQTAYELVEQLERDIGTLMLDLDHRIVQPFAALTNLWTESSDEDRKSPSAP